MSKKRTTAILNLLDSYTKLHNFKFPEPLLTDLEPLVASYRYKEYIKAVFIKNPAKNASISIKAIEAITENIKNFIDSWGSADLEPISDVLQRHPLTYIETIIENARSIFENLFTSTAITPLENEDSYNIQSPRHGDELPTRFNNIPDNNAIGTDQDQTYSQSSAFIHREPAYDNHEIIPSSVLGASSYSEFPL